MLGTRLDAGGAPTEATATLCTTSTVHATDAPAGQFGIFFYGLGQIQNPLGDGFLCVGSSIGRFGVVTTDPSGGATQWVDFANLPPAGVDIQPGTTCSFQFWYRDPAFGGSGSNLSDALEATFCN